MIAVKTRRATLGRILLLSVGLIALSAGAYCLWCKSEGEERWRAMQRQVDELLRETRVAPGPRPILRGAALPGNAWDDYLPALKKVEDIRWYTPEWKAATEFHSGKKDVNRPALRTLLETHGASIEALRRGTLREHGQYPYDWSQAPSMAGPGGTASTALGMLAICQAQLHAEEGRFGEAAELILDVGAFARDHGFGATQVSRGSVKSLLSASVDHLAPLVLSRKLPQAVLLQAGRELEILDASIAEDSFMEGRDVLSLGLAFLNSKDLYRDIRKPTCMCLDHVLPPWGGWRYGFSDRLVVSTAFQTALRCSQEAAAVRSASWSEAKVVLLQLEDGFMRTRNPIVQSHVAPLLSHTLRPELARLRLLRAAVGFRATGDIPELEDPFGTRIRHQKTGSRLKVWSIGKDGVDDGGQGQWKLSHDKNRDIVLELDF